MPNQSGDPGVNASGWRPIHAYLLGAVCLLLGVLAGYLVRGSASPSANAAGVNAPLSLQAGPDQAGGTQHMPTLEQMKHMADKKAEPLLAKLKTDPNNAALLIQIAQVYRSTHQFKEAAQYYSKSLDIEPRNIAIRTEMASCLYYAGDIDGALSALRQAVQDDPKDANSLFNLGVIEWREKKDAQGALAAWRQLLKANPNLDNGKKTEVTKLIADVSQQAGK
ncbi:MAG TPA: tetratricopeptide repeat protein [Terriglobales bacterium]|nr:tetratricopeptide repeat protein [Terriglobales bacterium]